MADWTWHPGAIARVPLQGAIVVCYGGDGGPTLADWTWHQGAVAGCHCSVLWLGGEGDDQGSGRGASAGCHCSVLWVMTNFGGVDVVPLQGAIVVCYGGGREG